MFDNFFDTVIGPSTSNAIAMIVGQSGATQWIKHPELASNVNTTNAQVPLTAEPQPFWGSAPGSSELIATTVNILGWTINGQRE